ncbi:hypothetical protein ISS03_01875 [Patescibacteria group bacterium]|nr:hypothetical protein [Patescibacteria group bacterium]
MEIISELYYWSLVKRAMRQGEMSQGDFTAMYFVMQSRAYEFIRAFKDAPSVTFVEFATRRRNSFRWQRFINDLLQKHLPQQFLGASNVLIAMKNGSANPIGTNAHELRMVYANITPNDNDDEIRESQYQVDRDWMKMYPELGILLPDTFGSTQYFAGAERDIAQNCTGSRFDSKEPVEAGKEFANWLEGHGVDPKEKLALPSDGLTAETAIHACTSLSSKFKKASACIGTNLGNNCSNVWPLVDDPGFKPFSMVIKATEANGRSAVKLSDNPNKAMGSPERVERFKKIFGVRNIREQEVLV